LILPSMSAHTVALPIEEPPPRIARIGMREKPDGKVEKSKGNNRKIAGTIPTELEDECLIDTGKFVEDMSLPQSQRYTQKVFDSYLSEEGVPNHVQAFRKFQKQMKVQEEKMEEEALRHQEFLLYREYGGLKTKLPEIPNPFIPRGPDDAYHPMSFVQAQKEIYQDKHTTGSLNPICYKSNKVKFEQPLPHHESHKRNRYDEIIDSRFIDHKIEEREYYQRKSLQERMSRLEEIRATQRYKKKMHRKFLASEARKHREEEAQERLNEQTRRTKGGRCTKKKLKD